MPSLVTGFCLCPDPQLAVCCFCGTKKSSYSRKDGAWPEVSRTDMQRGRTASGVDVQLHPLFRIEAAQAVEVRQCQKKKGAQVRGCKDPQVAASVQPSA